MKKAVPPTAAAARIPTMITDAIRTETHVLRLLCAIRFALSGPPDLPDLPGLFHQTTGFVSGSRIVVGVAEPDRLLQFRARRRFVPGVHRNAPELELRARVNPFPGGHR